MNPIYDEYINFLRNTSGMKLHELKEGYFWLDNQIIKGFDKSGNIHKLWRVKISDSLDNVAVAVLKNYSNINDIELASWQDLIELHKVHLQKLEQDSLKLIKEKNRKI